MAYVNAVHFGHFLRQVVGRFANMVVGGTRTVNNPSKLGFVGLVLQNSFSQGAAANIAEAHHQNFHARKDKAGGGN